MSFEAFTCLFCSTKRVMIMVIALINTLLQARLVRMYYYTAIHISDEPCVNADCNCNRE